MDSELEDELRAILARNGQGARQVVHRGQVDLTARIPNNEDRHFTESVIDLLRGVEPSNRKVIVDIATNEPSYIFVWAEGYRKSIDLSAFAAVMRMEHPVAGFKGIDKVYIHPSEHGSPTKFVVKIARSAGVRPAPSLEYYDTERAVVPRRAVKARRPTRRGKRRSISPVRVSSESSESSSSEGVLTTVWNALTK